MRIGEFAAKNHISIDTIRHYIDIGLLNPDKVNGQYNFYTQCQQKIEDVFLLKEMGFKLSDIKTIIMFNSLGNMSNFQKDEYYRMLFENKYQSVIEDIKKLETTKDKISSKLKELDETNNKKKCTIGVPLDALSRLKCLKCKSNVSIKNGEIIDNQIVNGVLSCKCGEEYKIQDGMILVTKGSNDEENYYDNHFITNYIRSTDSLYLENIYKVIDWIKRNIDFHALENKTILEIGSGVGFALRNLYHLLPDDCLYIAIDHDYKILCLCSALLILVSSSNSVFAAEKHVNPNQVISKCENVKIPKNVKMSKSTYAVYKAASVTYDPNSGIDWDKGNRSVWGSCQAKQGDVKLDSYSRARFESAILRRPYLDSGRVWSTNQGRSFAQSGWEKFDSLNSGVACTYYGIGVD